MITVLETIYSTAKLQMKEAVTRPTFRFCLLIQPIIYSLITYKMFINSGHDNFVAYTVLGTGILTLWSCICFSSAGDIERERYMGTLQVIYNTPTNFKVIILGKILGNTMLGLLPFFISFAFVRLFLGGDMYIKDPMAFGISMIITIASFMGISMLFAAVFTLSRSSRILMNCIEYPVFILCGILFPIEILPKWTIPLSYILSPTWAVKLLRLSVEGLEGNDIFCKYFGILTTITIIYFILSNILFKIIDNKTRIKATLGVV
ncbi:ABC transporter permease [Alkaliphilus serpentinus]|uniref:ABC transporter permease n=1 Tax=Alkaliphilus serpentinus TaxID=1482731 RepID=A0A833HNS2_9FIRM|nr:ABC transporter permease [Alkaliphilus serpentinus]KAB3529858.1 ABC transporter permease [Alkaliphilus serpentinus]